nr:PREDICTED: C->U-editing enzyme APOBEC-1 [Anolis carolinensis]|eukprot:XP_016846277.1 PREDICTED: C-_U-editing enzyme APOBEC-1 [Anolis carolinensis]
MGYQAAILLSNLFFRWQMEPEAFQRNFDPREFPECTLLLYEIHWDNNTSRNWCTNKPGLHAEENFLQIFNEKIDIRQDTPCSITWFLSWSPCYPCSQAIIKFLEAHPNVSLEIKAARLYMHQIDCNKEGLRNLGRNRVSIMNLPDYRHCWTTFVVPRGANEDYWPQDFLPAITNYSRELDSILQD